MTTMQIISVCLIGSGLALFAVSLILRQAHKKRIASMNVKAKGTVIDYSDDKRSGLVSLPVVRYDYEGMEYMVKGPIFSQYLRKKISENPDMKLNFSSADNIPQKLMINSLYTGLDYHNPVTDILPVGTEVDVYLDGKRPERSYVIRPVMVPGYIRNMMIASICIGIIGLALLILK